ncbi:MAG: DEAD/DEAH box helicase [Candidatus Hydrogenedentes bacterium]|nr:DEAD/DEAH box helicase [Candidatus Hydrogenedentota bacterium]
MKMTELLRYDVPPEVIRLWQTQESEHLLPVQELAIKRHNLFGNGNLLIQAPTSSGKTFVGEMAAIQTALRRKKVIYLVPLKALAEEKYLDFNEKYTPYGLKVIISTRDHRHFDAQLESGDFSIAIVVYEKLSQVLVRRPERFTEVELVVADELELLSDPERGATVELLLTQVLQSGCRVLGMSAVLGEADKLAQWMQAELVQYDRRPVELRYGVLHQGVFRYRTYNEFSEDEERLVDAGLESSAWETLMENVGAFTAQEEPCLIFVKAKHESRRGAELLAQHLSLPASEHTIERLQDLESTHSRDKLLEILANGVAFHNADLSPEERRIVEEGFRRGEIKAMVSTSTLAIGLNLPAQNVFMTSEKWQYDTRFSMPWKTPILRSEYENMGGRAGRYGSGKAFGRSILIAPTPFDHETLWRRYVEGPRESVKPQLAEGNLEDHALRLVASRACTSEETLRTFFESTLTGQWLWNATLTLEEVEFRVRTAVNRAIDAGMLARVGDNRLEATPFGHAVTVKGITIATGLELAAWIRESETRHWSATDLLLAAALTPDARGPYLSLTAREYDHADYPSRLKRLTMDEDLGADVPLNRLRNCDLMPFFEEVRAIKETLVMLDWMEQAGLYDIEEKFRVFAGQIFATADQLGWLIDAIAAIAAAFGAQQQFIDRLLRYAERVQWGVGEHLLPLVHLHLKGMNRNTLLALEAHHIDTPESLLTASEAQIARWVGKANAKALKAWAQRELEHTSSSRPSPAPEPVLVVDERHPGQIMLDGQIVQLQDKQYRLLRVLAEAPGECVSYDRIYNAVWGEAVVESNQMHFQKRKVLDRVKRVAPGRSKIIRTVPKRGFVLELAPEEVLLGEAVSSQTAA